MGEPDRDLDDANITQLLIRRDEEAQPSAQFCAVRNKNYIT